MHRLSAATKGVWSLFWSLWKEVSPSATFVKILIPSVKGLVAPFCCSGTFKVEGVASNEHKVDLNQQTWLKQQRYLVGHQGRGTDVDAVWQRSRAQTVDQIIPTNKLHTLISFLIQHSAES